MNLQPLYDVKSRLEQAALAGAGLLAEDFRLQRAAEGLKPLAAASPVFGKIDSGLAALLSAPPEERSGRLLDLLALVDAVAYTQGVSQIEGELTPLPPGQGVCLPLSYCQLHPVLEALTTTGGGRMEVIQSAWENRPELFSDFRVLPALVAGLGDSYGELAGLNARILKQMGPAPLPLLKEGFDPAGSKAMARRVEVIAALEGAGATPWLREILPQAKKDVRAAVLAALGADPENTPLLLELAQTEKGANRDAVLKALSSQDGAAVAPFWGEELEKNPLSVLFLARTEQDWAGDLIAAGLQKQLKGMMAHGDRISAGEQNILSRWCQTVGKKTSSGMLDFWRWADGHMEEFDGFTNEKGNPVFLGVRLTDTLKDCLRTTGPGPLRDFCLELFDRRSEMTRYLHLSFLAAVLSRPAAEVFEKYSPYIRTEIPTEDTERAKTLHTVLLRALDDVWWFPQGGCYRVYGCQPAAEPLDLRWLGRMTRAVWTDVQGSCAAIQFVYWEDVGGLDRILIKQTNPGDEAIKQILIPYARRRMAEKGQPYTYSRWLFYMGASPRGLLGKTLARKPNENRLYAVWQLMYEAYQALGPEEAIALLEEILAEGAFQKQAAPHLQKAIPWTVEQLRAGGDFPSNIDWSKL